MRSKYVMLLLLLGWPMSTLSSQSVLGQQPVGQASKYDSAVSDVIAKETVSANAASVSPPTVIDSLAEVLLTATKSEQQSEQQSIAPTVELGNLRAETTPDTEAFRTVALGTISSVAIPLGQVPVDKVDSLTFPPSTPTPTVTGTPANSTATGDATALVPDWEDWVSPERLSGNLRLVAVMAALSLAPALLLMTTCYVRIVVVLSLLRQALGSQQLPPNQVTTTLAMFLTALIMWPVWSKVHHDSIEPYTNPNTEMSAEAAWTAGVAPVRDFMSQQIHDCGNRADVLMFLEYLPPQDSPIESYADVPLQALLPAFLLSELKVAFTIGFMVYLPFVLIDLVVSSVTMSLGWVMVPPTTISLPMKLILFVLVDGWHLVVEMLLMSFQTG